VKEKFEDTKEVIRNHETFVAYLMILEYMTSINSPNLSEYCDFKRKLAAS
jgi:hypothetical protein